MPIDACQVRSKPDNALDAEGVSHGYGPRHSRTSIQWLGYDVKVSALKGMLHAANWPEVWLGLRHLPMDGYHPDTATVFQFHGCLFHGHDCRKFEDAWFWTTAQERREHTEGTKTTWGSLVTTRSWPSGSASGRPSSAPTPAQRRVSMDVSQPPMAGSHLPAPGTDMQALLWAICEDFGLFGLTQVDIHIPEGLKDKFRDLPPIYKSFSVSKEDAGPHMAQFWEDAGVVSQPWWSLIVSYFGGQVLIPTPLLRWYLLNGLVVTCLYLQMQYDRHQCFQSLAEACAQKQWDAHRDPLQALAGESLKLLMTSVYGKCSENKTCFMQTYFVKGPVDSKAVASNRFRDMRPLLAIPLPEVTHSACALPEMDPEDMTEDSGEPEGDGDEDDAPEAVPADHYQLAMAPEHLTMDLLVQITVFGYTYAKLRMLQLRYDLLGEYADHRCWELLYMDTDSYYMSLGGNSLHDCLRPECLLWVLSWMVPQRGLWCAQGRVRGHHDTPGAPHGYLAWQCCEAHWLYDEKTPGLFKTEWCGDGMVALCSKTYYCRDAEGHDKLSSKGLQKNANSNALIYEAYRRVLATGSLSGGMNRCIQTGPTGTYTPTGRSGPTCTLKRVWQMMASTQSPCTCERHSQPSRPSACLPTDKMAASIITDASAGGDGEYEMHNLWLQWPFRMLLAGCSGSGKSTLTTRLVALSSHIMTRMPAHVLLFYSLAGPLPCGAAGRAWSLATFVGMRTPYAS